MKIIFLNPQGNFDAKDRYWTEHPDFGGQLVYVKEIACALSELGIRVDIVTRRFKDDQFQGFDQELDGYPGMPNVRIVRIHAGDNRFLSKELLWPYLPEWCENIHRFYEQHPEKPTFLTGHYGDGGICAAILSKKWDIPFSFTAHSLGAWKREKLLNQSRAHQIPAQVRSIPWPGHVGVELEAKYHFSPRIIAERIAMQYAEVIFASTRMEQQEQYAHPDYQGIENLLNAEKFAIVPPGVNRKIFHEKNAEEDAFTQKMIPSSGPCIVLASRIDEKKNHLQALKAYAKSGLLRKNAKMLISIRYPNPFYTLEGVPEADKKIMHSWIEYIETEKITENVVFFQANSQEKLSSLYRASRNTASAFCLPAVYEPFGLAVIEAMSCGLPVAATRNGGPSEILFDGKDRYGVLFDPENTDDIARALEEILFESDYATLSKISVERVEDKYSWESAAKGYIAAIEQALTRKKCPYIDLQPFFKAIACYS